MTRILVTGATGFVGLPTIQCLVGLGYEVHILDPSPAPILDVTVHQGNLLSRNGVRACLERSRPHHLLHLAWGVEPGEFWTTRANLDWLSASLDLYRRFADAGGGRVITVGSCAEYDWRGSATLRPLVEYETLLQSHTLYGQCKNAMAELVAAAAGLDGIAHAHARIFFPYGFGESPQRLVSGAITQLLADKPFRSTDGLQVRDFIHVEDTGAALAQLCHSDVTGPVNIASGEGVRVCDLLGAIADKLGKRHLLEMGALPRRGDEPMQIVADVKRLREALRFTPKYDLAAGLDATIAGLSDR